MTLAGVFRRSADAGGYGLSAENACDREHYHHDGSDTDEGEP